MATRVIKADTDELAMEAAKAGAKALRAGQLVGFATETVYGIAACADDDEAMERLRVLKSRPARPFSVHIGRREDVARYVAPADVPDMAARLIHKAMPGPVTVLLPTGGKLADAAIANLYDRLASGGVIGLRCPDAPVAAAMLSAVPWPVVAPSANLAGAPSPRTAGEVLDALDGKIDLLIDSGPTRYGKDSTIVDFGPAADSRHGPEQWRVVREGVYDERMIRKFMFRTYLFVCTGNTCRSPIAAGVARMLLARRLGVAQGELAQRGVEVLSAGLYARNSARATPEAMDAAAQLGADISAHRSRKLTPELIRGADLIFCMTRLHADQVRQMAPEAAARVLLLDDAGDIPDPVGGGADVYQQTAVRIEAALDERFEKGLP